MEKIQEGAVVVQEKAQELKANAGERVRQELDTRSSEAGSQLQGTAAAMRRTTEQLRQEGKDGPAKAMEFVAERAERLGSYLTGADASQPPSRRRGVRPTTALARGRWWGGSRLLRLALLEGVEQCPLPGEHGYRLPAAGMAADRASRRATLACDGGVDMRQARPKDDEAAVLTYQRGSSNG